MPGGVGPGITPTWFCQGAELGGLATNGSGGSGPTSGSGAWSCAPAGLRPVGMCSTGPVARGTAMFGGAAPLGPGVGSVWAQGSAIAGGATTIGVARPIAAAADTEASRETADMSHLSGTRSMLDVTIVTSVNSVIIDALIDMHS